MIMLNPRPEQIKIAEIIEASFWELVPQSLSCIKREAIRKIYIYEAINILGCEKFSKKHRILSYKSNGEKICSNGVLLNKMKWSTIHGDQFVLFRNK